MRFTIVPAISDLSMRRSIVARQQRFSDLREKAKGRGPEARVAGMVLAQIKGERVRPL